MKCKACGGNRGQFNENGNHRLCEARLRSGSETPSLGDKCSVCGGTLSGGCVHCRGTGSEPGSIIDENVVALTMLTARVMNFAEVEAM